MADRRGYTSLYQNIPVQPLAGYSDPSAFIRVREAVRGLEDQVNLIRGTVGNSVPGYVSSVGLTAPAIFSVTGSPVTDTGTIALSLVSQTARSVFAAPTGLAGTPTFRALEALDIQSGTFGITRGGTGLSLTPTNGQLLIGNGTGYTLANLTAGSGISITDGSGSITVTNTLPGFVNPMTTLGDIIYGGASGVATRLGGETTTTRKFLRSVGVAGAATAPAWDTVTKTDVGLSNVENTALSTWAGSTNLTTLGTIGTGVWNGTKIEVGYGGTGLTSVAANAILIGSTSTTLGTIGPPGMAGTYFLSYSSTLPGYQWTDTIGVADGGTGLSSYTVGDLLYASGTTALAKLAVVDKGILYGTATGPAYTAAADMAWDNTNKRLGIGNAVPLYSLHVEKGQNASTAIAAINTSAGTAARGQVFAQSDLSSVGVSSYSSTYTSSGGILPNGASLNATGSAGLSIMASNATGSIRFYTSSVSAFRGEITSAGLWGIGPDSSGPVDTLSVAQYQNAATSVRVFNTDTGANASANIFLYTTANTGLELTSPGATKPNQLKLFSPLSGGVILEASNASGIFAVATGGVYSANERFRIAANGRAGLGTSSPQVLLHVDGTAATLDTDLYNNTDTILAVQNGGTGFRMVSATSDPTNIGNVPAVVWMTGRGTVSAATAVSSGDYLGRVLVQGIATGGGRAVSSEIRAAVDAAPGTSFVPGRFEFFTTNSSGTQAERMRLTSDGYLGIGKTPSTVLDIVHTVAGNAAVNMANSSADPAATARFILNNSATSGGLQIRSSAHATEPSDILLYSSANNIRFYTNGNLRGTVLSNGNFTYDTDTFFIDAANNRVGIGTTSAFAKLDFGDTNAAFNTTTPGTTRYGIHFQSGATNDYATGITWAGNGTGGGAAQAGIYVQSSDAYGTKMYFATTGAYATGAQTAMMIDQNRRVGVGTTSPSYLFDVAETSANAATAKIMQRNILTMNPTAVSIALGDAFNSQMVLNGSANNFTVRQSAGTFSVSHTGTGTVTRADGVTVLAFSKATAGTITALSAFRADSPSVSAGTVSTAYGLYVDTMKASGVTTGYGVYQASTSDLNYFAGNVGVGATSPGVRLDVSETLAVASSATFSAAAIRMNPVYTATGTITVKHRYIHFTQPTISGGTTTFTDAHTMYFDAAAGTHKAVDSGTTKTTPGTVNAWVKIDINGTTYYIPAYTSKTT